MNTDTDQITIRWCQATRCGCQVPHSDWMLCYRHAAIFAGADTDLYAALQRFDWRGWIDWPKNLDTLDRLELLARAVEWVAAQEGHHGVVHPFRVRANAVRIYLEARGQVAPAPTTAQEPAGRTDGVQRQGRLLEGLPSDAGQYKSREGGVP